MKFTFGWLKDHLETDATLDAVAEKLTALGLEVEDVIDRGAALAPFVVGHVVSAEPHPDADRLRVCRVDTGNEVIQVVCGAPNARTGMKGVFARSGLTIPGTGVKLKAATIRGVDSNGMLCSEREMGLGDDHDGIIELPEDAPIGGPAAVALGLDDPLLDVAITPDRADCLGVRGIARDLAAAGLGALKPLDATPVPGAFESPLHVHLDFDAGHADACPLFVGRLIRGVRNGESPAWLRRRLIAIGLGDESQGRRIPITDANGRRVFLRYHGREVWSKLDAATLRKMVEATPGGRYLNVATGSINFGSVYVKLVDSAAKSKLGATKFKKYEEKFQIFLTLAFILLCIEIAVGERKPGT